MNAKVDNLSKTVSSGIAQAQDKASETLDSAKRTMDHTINHGKELASDAASAANNALKSASGLTSELEAMARSNPLTALMGAALVGVVIGMMLKSSR